MRVSFYDVLTAHAAMYPEMEAQDYVKLAFQSEFGCGHLLSDREAALTYLRDEMDAVKSDALEPFTVTVGGGFARLNLAAVKRFLSPELVYSMFEKSASPVGSKEGFARKISLMRRASLLGIIPCNGDAIARAAEELGDGIPSHSARYKRLYGASYRLVTDTYAVLVPAVCLIADALAKAGRITVGIDGRAASGKTTAATLLADLFDTTLIHADDYFLPYECKTERRLAEPGGNIDAERLEAEVLSHREDDTVTHARFDCVRQCLQPSITERRREVLMVEGVYTLRPDWISRYDVKLFFDIDKETQYLRLREREEEAVLQRYLEEWLPLEERYFSELSPMLNADLTLRF